MEAKFQKFRVFSNFGILQGQISKAAPLHSFHCFLHSFHSFLHSFHSFLHSFLSFLNFCLSFLVPLSFPCFLVFISRCLHNMLDCLLHVCSLAAFTVAHLLPLLLLTCGLYFCSLALANLFCGFVKRLVVDRESLQIHFNIFSNPTWRDTCQF